MTHETNPFASWRFGAQVYVSSLNDLLDDLIMLERRVEKLANAKRGLAINARPYKCYIAQLKALANSDIIDHRKAIKNAEAKHNERMFIKRKRNEELKKLAEMEAQR